MAVADEVALTPTEELILDVLAARFRTGESVWTFGSRTHAAAASLERKGLVALMAGQVERTYRASLTITGQKLCTSDTYSSPIDQAREKAYDEGWQHGMNFAAGKEDFMHNPYRTAR